MPPAAKRAAEEGVQSLQAGSAAESGTERCAGAVAETQEAEGSNL